MLRRQISSSVEDLNQLHSLYYWIPNEETIRPSPDILREKLAFSEYVFQNYMSFKDFILATHFGYSFNVEDKLMYVPQVLKAEWNFRKSLFPYNMLTSVNHYILWNSTYDINHSFDEQTINELLQDTLIAIVGSDRFDFAWYINPKPSIPDLWHCQVFWVRTD